jgi:hypothetical protein
MSWQPRLKNGNDLQRAVHILEEVYHSVVFGGNLFTYLVKLVNAQDELNLNSHLEGSSAQYQ